MLNRIKILCKYWAKGIEGPGAGLLTTAAGPREVSMALAATHDKNTIDEAVAPQSTR
jgi:hypothetical protein